MSNISVCIVVNDLFYETKFCIDNLLSKTQIKPEIIIFNNNSEDLKYNKYFEELKENHNLKIINSNQTLNLSQCYNELIKNSSNNFICFFPVNTLVNKNWLEDLLFNYKNCVNPGVIGIRNGLEDIKLTPILFNEEVKGDVLNHVWVTDKGFIEGIMFLDKDKLKEIEFDENTLCKGYESIDFSLRVFFLTYLNFYITKQNCYKINLSNTILFPKKGKEESDYFNLKIKRIIKNNIISE